MPTFSFERNSSSYRLELHFDFQRAAFDSRAGNSVLTDRLIIQSSVKADSSHDFPRCLRKRHIVMSPSGSAANEITSTPLVNVDMAMDQAIGLRMDPYLGEPVSVLCLDFL